MFKVPQHFPQSAIRRLPQQAAIVNTLHSCHQEIVVPGFTTAELASFKTGPPAADYASLLVRDHNQILPYTTLEFLIDVDSRYGADTPYACNLWTDTGNTAAQATAQMVAQINVYARVFGVQFPDMANMRARAISGDPDNSFIIYMPWGMLGEADFDWDGPNPEGVLPGNFGVDNPLIFGIIGPRRHVFGVRYPYRDDYYGDVEIG